MDDAANAFPGYAAVSNLLSEMFHALVPNDTPSDQFDAKLNYADDLRRRMWDAIAAYRDESTRFALSLRSIGR